ncbi:MAG: cbb3-type cytochrome oxidase assembly protein CcoS [Bacteroidetes bacterium]|nr:MAG: cbb3-type cytochrome oxidase assembly protein CcoS [Bacteroidota bacterium]
MSVILIMIVGSFIVAAGFLAAFLWSVRSGQYEDKYTPSVRILLDDAPTNNGPSHQSSN